MTGVIRQLIYDLHTVGDDSLAKRIRNKWFQ